MPVKRQILSITLTISTLLMLIKFWAYYITNSDAILTDALESIINVIAGAFALFSIILATKPRDRSHPYGHGKIEFISAGLEGSLIVLAGISMIAKAIYSFVYPHNLDKIDIGLYLTVFSTLVNYFTGLYLVRQGEKHNSLTLVADGKHIQSDAFSSIGLIIGLGLIYLTNWNALDGIFAIIFAIIIIYTGLHLLRTSISGVMDEADVELLKQVIAVLNKNRQEYWIDFHNLRIIKYGSALHIDCHLTLPWYWDLERGHQEVNKVEEIIDKQMGNQVEVFIHLDPCISDSCKICGIADCKVRKFAFETQLTWDLENVLENHKHQLK
jgi:cation diffusion facilitator family transporter